MGQEILGIEPWLLDLLFSEEALRSFENLHERHHFHAMWVLMPLGKH